MAGPLQNRSRPVRRREWHTADSGSALAFILDAIVIGVVSTALVPLFGAGSMVQTGANQVEATAGGRDVLPRRTSMAADRSS